MVLEIPTARLCDLGLEMESSDFSDSIRELGSEMERAEIALRPRFYLSTGYGCVVRTTNIGLLFTDGFAETRKWARSVGLRVRNRPQILRTLRHEVGHAFCYGHRLHESDDFRRLFGVRGDFFATYPERWKPDAEARSRVSRGEIINLYAGRHPDEDFAICFQTWLQEPGRWRERFRGRPAIVAKLDFVAEMAARLGPVSVTTDPEDLDEPLWTMRMTFAEWLDEVRRNGDYTLFPKGPVA